MTNNWKMGIALSILLCGLCIALSAVFLYRGSDGKEPDGGDSSGIKQTFGESSETEPSGGNSSEAKPSHGDSSEAKPSHKDSSESFALTYDGQESDFIIYLKYCKEICAKDGIEAYSYLVDGFFVPESFPAGTQYVLLIHTAGEWLQLYPVKEFLVDEEAGDLYMEILYGGEPGKIQKVSLKGGKDDILASLGDVVSAREAENLLCSAHNLSRDGERETWDGLWVRPLAWREDEGGRVVTGEIGGVYRATGKTYYADWELTVATGLNRAEPCVLKTYDGERDGAAFAECGRAFDKIERGDWSMVNRTENMDYVWENGGKDWWRVDVNGDGMPELLNGYEYEEDSEIIRQVDLIFTWREGAVDVVYYDWCDGMEFLFLAANDNLIYEWCVTAGPPTAYYERCRFDEKWNREALDILVMYDFYEDEYWTERVAEYYRERYPDTYGTGGVGLYFLRARPKTEEELRDDGTDGYLAREYLTKEQWIDAYREMTGQDFYNMYLDARM